MSLWNPPHPLSTRSRTQYFFFFFFFFKWNLTISTRSFICEFIRSDMTAIFNHVCFLWSHRQGHPSLDLAIPNEIVQSILGLYAVVHRSPSRFTAHRPPQRVGPLDHRLCDRLPGCKAVKARPQSSCNELVLRHACSVLQRYIPLKCPSNIPIPFLACPKPIYVYIYAKRIHT